MNVHKIVMGAAAIAVAVGISTASADDQGASYSSCVKLSERVKSALADNQQASNLNDARRENMSGQEFCSSGLYEVGTAHYRLALKLLGVSDQGGAQKN